MAPSKKPARAHARTREQPTLTVEHFLSKEDRERKKEKEPYKPINYRVRPGEVPGYTTTQAKLTRID